MVEPYDHVGPKGTIDLSLKNEKEKKLYEKERERRKKEKINNESHYYMIH